MNWVLILLVSTSTLIIYLLAIRYINKSNPTKLLDKNISLLNSYLTFEIFEQEEVYVSLCWGGRYEKQTRFEKTKNNLLNKCNGVYSTICNMVNLYIADNKITKFYDTQLKALHETISEIEEDMESLSKSNEKGENFNLSESDKVKFNKYNNKINKQITSFIVGNAKFFTYLKFKKITNENSNFSYEELSRYNKRKTILSFILSTLLSIGVGVLVNYISYLFGII